MDAVLRGRATEGGRGVGLADIAEAPGNVGTVGVAGEREGARIGDDFATGSGKFGVEACVTSKGGVTDEVIRNGGLAGRSAFGIVIAGGRAAAVGRAGTLGTEVVSCRGREGGCGKEGIKGGCGARGSGTRSAGDNCVCVRGTVGRGGIGVRDVSFVPSDRVGIFAVAGIIDSGVIFGRVPVAGSAGGRLPAWMGSKSLGISTLPLLTKTFACGFATMTRGGAICPDAVVLGIGPDPEAGRLGGVTGGVPTGGNSLEATNRAGTVPVSGGALPVVANTVCKGAVFDRLRLPLIGGDGGRGDEGVGKIRGCVLARDDPKSDADCLTDDDAVGDTKPVGGRVAFCIGWVTAVDHAGMLCGTVGPILSDDFIGKVAEVGLVGRGPSCVESGFKGRGGRLTRKVSRFCVFGSAEGGASSAISKLFIYIPGNVQWRNW